MLLGLYISSLSSVAGTLLQPVKKLYAFPCEFSCAPLKAHLIWNCTPNRSWHGLKIAKACPHYDIYLYILYVLFRSIGLREDRVNLTECGLECLQHNFDHHLLQQATIFCSKSMRSSSKLAKLFCPVTDSLMQDKNYWLELIAMYIKGRTLLP